MKNELQTLSSVLTFPKVEAIISKLDEQLTVMATHQSQHAPATGFTNAYSNLTFNIPVHKNAQTAMDEIKSQLLVAAKVDAVKTERADLTGTLTRLDHAILEMKIKTDGLKAELERVKGNKRTFYAKQILTIVSIAAGIADALFTYKALRHGFNSFLMAGSLSIIAGLFIAFGHLIYVSWIFAIKDPKKQWARTFVILALAACFFLLLGTFRAQSLNSMAGLEIPGDVIYAPASIAHGYALGGISFFVFILVFLLSLGFYQKHKGLALYEASRKKVGEAENALAQMQQKRIDMYTVSKQREMHVKQLYEYASRGVNLCESLAYGAIANYQKGYILHHGQIPEFFLTPVHMDFDKNFLLHPQTDKP